jgi:hypothetical protein
MEFTQEEVQNLLVLVEAGARAISGQNQLLQAANVLAAAHNLAEKVKKLAPPAPEQEDAKQ